MTIVERHENDAVMPEFDEAPPAAQRRSPRCRGDALGRMALLARGLARPFAYGAGPAGYVVQGGFSQETSHGPDGTGDRAGSDRCPWGRGSFSWLRRRGNLPRPVAKAKERLLSVDASLRSAPRHAIGPKDRQAEGLTARVSRDDRGVLVLALLAAVSHCHDGGAWRRSERGARRRR